MRIFETDIQRVADLAMLNELQQDIVLHLLHAAVAPLVSLHGEHNEFRSKNLYRLAITPQVFSLEKMLNDRFDSEQRRIYIADSVFHNGQYIYLEEEAINLTIRTEAENSDIFLFLDSEVINYEDIDFIVNVPESVADVDADIAGTLNNYKLTGKSFIINRF